MPGPVSRLEQDMDMRIKLSNLPPSRRDYRFHPTRKWEHDWAWPEIMVYLAVEGGEGKSRHRGKANIYRHLVLNGERVKVKVGQVDGYAQDCMEHSEAAILGWLGVRVTASMIKDGTAIDLLKRAIAARTVEPF